MLFAFALGEHVLSLTPPTGFNQDT